MIYNKLREKFVDKGMIAEFYWFVLTSPPYDPSRLIDPNIETYHKVIQQVYGKEWDYWNTWIDYQKHK